VREWVCGRERRKRVVRDPYLVGGGGESGVDARPEGKWPVSASQPSLLGTLAEEKTPTMGENKGDQDGTNHEKKTLNTTCNGRKKGGNPKHGISSEEQDDYKGVRSD